jgi:hypothetical protein
MIAASRTQGLCIEVRKFSKIYIVHHPAGYDLGTIWQLPRARSFKHHTTQGIPEGESRD